MSDQDELRALLFSAELGDVPELDLHGMDRFVAEKQLEAFIDQMVFAGEEVISIVHGRGTGALRQVTRRVLRRHPHVRYFEDALSPGALLGVTLVVLYRL